MVRLLPVICRPTLVLCLLAGLQSVNQCTLMEWAGASKNMSSCLALHLHCSEYRVIQPTCCYRVMGKEAGPLHCVLSWRGGVPHAVHAGDEIYISYLLDDTSPLEAFLTFCFVPEEMLPPAGQLRQAEAALSQ